MYNEKFQNLTRLEETKYIAIEDQYLKLMAAINQVNESKFQLINNHLENIQNLLNQLTEQKDFHDEFLAK